jgi:hypothetical protein
MRKLFDKRRLEKDETGRQRCEPCWNGRHFHFSEKPRHLIIDCRGNGCECLCIDHLNNPPKRARKDKSLQTAIDTGDDVIQFGPAIEHRDNG